MVLKNDKLLLETKWQLHARGHCHLLTLFFRLINIPVSKVEEAKQWSNSWLLSKRSFQGLSKQFRDILLTKAHAVLIFRRSTTEEGDQVSRDQSDQSQWSKEIFTRILSRVRKTNFLGYLLLFILKFLTYRVGKRPKNDRVKFHYDLSSTFGFIKVFLPVNAFTPF